jgi:hypothetical protein
VLATSENSSPQEALTRPGESVIDMMIPLCADEEPLDERMERFRQRKARKKAERAERISRGIQDYGSHCSSGCGGSSSSRRESGGTGHTYEHATTERENATSTPDRTYKSAPRTYAHMRKYVSAHSTFPSPADSKRPPGFVRTENDLDLHLVPTQPTSPSSATNPRWQKWNSSASQRSTPDSAERLETSGGGKDSFEHRHLSERYWMMWIGLHGAGWYELPASTVSHRSSIASHWHLQESDLREWELRLWTLDPHDLSGACAPELGH